MSFIPWLDDPMPFREQVAREIRKGERMLNANLELAVDSAGWFWCNGSAWGDIRPYATKNDFYRVTVSINGGYNHVRERKDNLNKLAKLINCSFIPNEFKFDKYHLKDSSMIQKNYYKNNKTLNLNTKKEVNA